MDIAFKSQLDRPAHPDAQELARLMRYWTVFFWETMTRSRRQEEGPHAHACPR